MALSRIRKNAGPDSTIHFQLADNTPPTLLSSSPDNLQKGLPARTRITLNFSEPMNRSSIETTFKANYGPQGQGQALNGAFLWYNNEATMVFDTLENLPYGEDVQYRIGTGAKDKAGNALATETVKSFRVIREITVGLPAYGAGHILYETPYRIGFADAETYTTYTNELVIRVGDRSFEATHIYTRQFIRYSKIFLAFKIYTIPTGATITAARLQVVPAGSAGNPFAYLGKLGLYRVNIPQNVSQPYSLPNNEATFYSPTLPCDLMTRCALTFSSANIDADVLKFVSADQASSFATSQFELGFATNYADAYVNNYQDYAKYPVLTVTYLYP